jgi:hypothetical protein
VDKTRPAKGYGESQLINKCADNVNCTAEEHQTDEANLLSLSYKNNQDINWYPGYLKLNKLNIFPQNVV